MKRSSLLFRVFRSLHASMSVRALALAVVASFLAACGGGGAEAGAPKSGGDKKDNDGVPSVKTPDGTGATHAIGDAEREFDRDFDAYEAAGKDCVMMCKALSSMTRSADAICSMSLSGSDADKMRCDDAKTKVAEATKQVKATCGGCGT